MYPITVDFSRDRSGFYGDKIHQDTFKQAVQDWDYYLADMQTTAVAVQNRNQRR